jgi:phosphate transport system ATP-binding protein
MDPHIRVHDLSVRYGPREVLRKLTLDIPRHGILGIIGPAGSAKSTFLTCLNRTLELQTGASYTGQVELDGIDVKKLEPTGVRRRVAMVLPLPVGLPMSVYDNVAFAPRMAGLKRKA